MIFHRRALLFALVPVFAAMLPAQISRTPVLVELFTSEGCSSCPPADALLAHLQQDQPVPSAEVIVLEEHVDYWNSLGWHDRFSSHNFTDRQGRYTQRLHADDNYTPQMVVDGTQQFVGSDAAHALRSIAQAARTAKVALLLSPIGSDGERLTGSVSFAKSSGSAPKAELYAAVIQSTASTQVERGENGGRTLRHVSVLQSIERIGARSDAGAAPLEFSLPKPRDVPANNLRVVVFLQQPGQGAILGAVASASLSAASLPTSEASEQPPSTH